MQNKSIPQPLRRSILISSILVMTGCGFKIRGPVTLPYKTIYISGGMTQDLKLYLTRLLKSGLNTVVVSKPDEAEIFLNITETPAKQILTYNQAGQITGYRLVEQVRFSVNHKDGDELIPQSDIYLTRDMDFSIGAPAAGENLEILLFTDMRQDVSAQILRRLGSLSNKKPITP
jgi:LPS-assembly lipoprotein